MRQKVLTSILASLILSFVWPSPALALTYLGPQSSGSEAFMRKSDRVREYWVLLQEEPREWQLFHYVIPFGRLHTDVMQASFASRAEAIAYIRSMSSANERREAIIGEIWLDEETTLPLHPAWL